jgi:hypothetical protein
MPQLEYIRTDTAEDAVSSLELASEFLANARDDARYWKWFVVALHSGIQSVFVLALKGTDGLLVQKPGVALAMLAAFEGKSMPPAPHMDNFLKLYKKLQHHGNLRSADAKPLDESPEQEEALRALDELRDEFLHFNTKSWSIQQELVTMRSRACLPVVSFLLVESRAIVWYESELESRAQAAIIKLQDGLRSEG